jgi:homoaconitase/3-isopropylmalate dehydratase large subunit
MALEENVKEFGIEYFGLADGRQGIVHIIGPEQVLSNDTILVRNTPVNFSWGVLLTSSKSKST